MQFVSSRAVLSSVAVSTTSAEALSPGDRKYAILHNASGQTIYVAFADTATTTEGGYSVLVADGSSYEIPGVYKGPVSVITSAGTGNISVTELA